MRSAKIEKRRREEEEGEREGEWVYWQKKKKKDGWIKKIYVIKIRGTWGIIRGVLSGNYNLNFN